MFTAHLGKEGEIIMASFIYVFSAGPSVEQITVAWFAQLFGQRLARLFD